MNPDDSQPATGPGAMLACPRCDRTPLRQNANSWACAACGTEFPSIDGIPWLFADPEASLSEWRNRLHFALKSLAHDMQRMDRELADSGLADLTQQRLAGMRDATEKHRDRLRKLLEPVDLQSSAASYETYLALRTRLPSDQGLQTYYANAHRDWAWGDEENEASIAQIVEVLPDDAAPGTTLVLGAGAGRLAYDIHRLPGAGRCYALDFNPLLMLIARRVTAGEQLAMYEFPIAPRTAADFAVERLLKAPQPADERFHLVLGDVLRPPFAGERFDTVVTPWLIDIVSEDFPVFARRINGLLRDGGRWVNFGSLAFEHASRARQYGRDEVLQFVADAGFATPVVTEATIPYMCSPASRHGRRERVMTFAAQKTGNVKRPERYKALPDWLVTGKEPVPALPSFRTQAVTTQVYTFIMSLIDGRRTIKDIARILESQKLMTAREAESSLRTFLTRMYEDAERQPKF